MGARQFPWLVFVLFIILITGPYIFAYCVPHQGIVFNGFLQNPIDGYSYLAKIQQGRSGTWLFHLPFTTIAHTGQPLFLYYLFLGFLSSVLRISNGLIFHLARVVNAILLFISAWYVIPRLISYKSIQIGWIFAVLFLCGGMGWLLLPLGSIPGDFWVAEIFPFLASYTNPHFPLSMVCMLWMVFAWIKLEGKVRFLILGAGGLLLAILQPFGNVIMGLVFSLDLIWSILRKEVVFPKWVALGWFALFSLPYMLYTLWIIRTDPVFAIWNEQNVTPLFSLQDAIFTISPGILFACFYIFHAIRNPDQTDRMLILWVIVSIGISLMPITLQRRFLLASYLPMTILGFKYLDHILADRPRVGRLLRTSWFILAIPTNLILVTMSILGVYNQNSILFIRQDVIDGFNWLKVNTRIDANILSGPVTSLYLPAYTGQGVVYGHPYETPNAEQNEEELLGCLRDGFMADCTDLIETQNINYILIGPEEKQTGWKTPAFQYQQVFQAGEVKIYEVAR